MRRIINSTYMSLDGAVQDPQNWTFSYRDEAAELVDHRVYGSGMVILTTSRRPRRRRRPTRGLQRST
jgi:hypothetical protein